jgi:Icc-related predicted phosphoesterase
MKILALSDEVVDSIYSPQIKSKFAGVDLVLGCGDLPFYYLEFIVTMLDVPLFYVAGNHDKPNQYLSDGRIISRAEGCESLDGVAARVRRADGARHSPLLLAGLGGSLRYNREPHHQYAQGEMTGRALRLAPALLVNRLSHGRYLDILITHAPPRGIHDGPDRAHTGFDVFLRLMDLCRPRYLLHGHAHVYRQDAVTVTRYKHTEVVNVYPYRLIEF